MAVQISPNDSFFFFINLENALKFYSSSRSKNAIKIMKKFEISFIMKWKFSFGWNRKILNIFQGLFYI